MKMLTLALLVSFNAVAAHKSIDVIYGDDNRADVFESRNSALVEASKSTAGMIPASALRAKGKDVVINGQTLAEKGICEKERFSKQIAAARCSGFLISENILVTAGHCAKTQSDCVQNKWVFDYKVDSADQVQVTTAASNVYSCKRIISQKLDEGMPQDDYAVIELDRKVLDRRPLAFRKAGKIARGQSVAVIGHPTGLPTKITDGANVRSLSQKFFTANLDTYGGNSGSAVFNTDTMEVEGILVRGENDYVPDVAAGCSVSFKCANDKCRGEDVTYISNVPGIKDL